MGGVVAMLVLLLTEGLLRLFLGPPPPPVLVATGLGPDQGYLVTEGELYRAQYQRVRPLPAFTPHKTGPRAAFVGGSAVHLGHYENEVEWPLVVGERLGIEALNLGAPAMDSFDLVRVVRELHWVEHDVLVVYTGHNDFGNAYFQERFGGLAGGTRAHLRRGLEHLQIYSQLRLLVQSRPTPRMGEYERQPITPEARKATLDYLEANLDQMLWYCQQRDVTMVLGTPTSMVLEMPIATCEDEGCPRAIWREGLAQKDGDLLRQGHDADWHALRAPTPALDMMRRWAADNEVHLVDVDAELPREPGYDAPASKHFMDLVHLSPEGHRATGALMAEALRPYFAQ